jgi:hypothetical protein
MNWVAYCIDCQEELENCPNGYFAEGAARFHHRQHPDHKVIVGYYYEEKKGE